METQICKYSVLIFRFLKFKNYHLSRRSYARFFDIMVEELGGEGGEDQFIDSFIGNMTLRPREHGVNSTVVCVVLGK